MRDSLSLFAPWQGGPATIPAMAQDSVTQVPPRYRTPAWAGLAAQQAWVVKAALLEQVALVALLAWAVKAA